MINSLGADQLSPQQAADFIVAMPVNARQMDIQEATLAKYASDPRLFANPAAVAQYLEATRELKQARSAFVRCAAMVGAAITSGLMRDPDNAALQSASRKWPNGVGSLTEIVGALTTAEAVAVIAAFLAAATFFALAFGVIGSLVLVGKLLAVIAGLIATTGGAVTMINASERANMEAAVKAAAAGLEPSPSAMQVVSQGIGAAKVLGVVGVIGLALWLFGRKRK